MKKISVLGLILILFSCSDFLEEDPKSEIHTDRFFTHPTHAYNAVNILYRSGVAGFYRAGAYSGSKAMLGGYVSGLFDNDYKGQELHVQLCQNLTFDGENLATYFEEIWDDCYDAISKANIAINNIPRTPGISENEKTQLLAQARFFRAFNYYYLVKNFGDVPLILNEYKSLDNLYVARNSSITIYEAVIEDLEFILRNEILDDIPMSKNEFRISKGSAATLLADVYLNISGFPVQENHYADAAKISRQIINSGNYSLIKNGSDQKKSAYNVMRLSDLEDEYMYQVEYNTTIESNYRQPSICYPSEATSWGIFKYSVTNNAYKPTKELLSLYNDSVDLRIQEKQFYHSHLTYQDDTAEVTKYFETAPFLWHDDRALFETGKTGKDMVVYRYAEVLLIAAEAIALTEGVTAEAIGYLADVRERANWKTERTEIVSHLSSLGTDEFIQEIWKERVKEFSLEYRIWSDVQRTRQFPVSCSEDKGCIAFVNVIGHTSVWGNTFEEKHLLFPLSENEIQRNPNLVQNPGY